MNPQGLRPLDGITYEDSDEETVVRLLGDITDVTEAISRTDISGTSLILHPTAYESAGIPVSSASRSLAEKSNGIVT